MEGVPAGGVLGEQVRAGQLGQRRAGLVGRHARPGWPRRRSRSPGPGAGPAAGTAGPPHCSAPGRTRRTPPGRRWLRSPPSNGSSARAASRSSAAMTASGKRGPGRGAGRGDGQRERQPGAARDDVVDRGRARRPPGPARAGGSAGRGRRRRTAGPGSAGRRPRWRPGRSGGYGWSRWPGSRGEPGSSGRTCSTSRALSRTHQHPLAGQQAAVQARPGRAGPPGSARPARRTPPGTRAPPRPGSSAAPPGSKPCRLT